MPVDLARQARALLDASTRTVLHNERPYTFTVPSPTTYPFQWFWDSCFQAIVWTHLDVERAKQEIRTLLTAQCDNGAIHHIIYWDQSKVSRAPLSWHWMETKGWRWLFGLGPKPKTSELIQPPVLAQAVMRIVKQSDDRAFLTDVLPRLDRYYAWLAETRDPNHGHLLAIIAPFESGLDWSPAFDPALGFLNNNAGPLRLLLTARLVSITNKLLFDYDIARILAHGRFHVKDVLVNSIYGLNLSILAQLHERNGSHERAAFWKREAEAVTAALVAKCWDPQRGLFFNLNGREERRVPIHTIQSIMPMILPSLPADIAATMVRRHIANREEFWLPFPLPSVAASEPTYSPQSCRNDWGIQPLSRWTRWILRFLERTQHMRYLWRGSTWINTNWYLVHGLRRHGFLELAQTLAQRTRDLTERSGFREYFDPSTGEGLGAKNFGWSTLVIDLEQEPRV